MLWGEVKIALALCLHDKKKFFRGGGGVDVDLFPDENLPRQQSSPTTIFPDNNLPRQQSSPTTIFPPTKSYPTKIFPTTIFPTTIFVGENIVAILFGAYFLSCDEHISFVISRVLNHKYT